MHALYPRQQQPVICQEHLHRQSFGLFTSLLLTTIIGRNKSGLHAIIGLARSSCNGPLCTVLHCSLMVTVQLPVALTEQGDVIIAWYMFTAWVCQW